MMSAPQLIVIGASAGAVEALGQILPALPAAFPAPVAVVVHVPPGKPSLLAELFAPRCSVRVTEARDKEELVAATVYFAPPDYHLLVEATQALALSVDPPVFYSRPSIDVLFESAAAAYGAGVTGVLLSGANGDGAAGLKAICAAGGRALVQDPATAQAKEMPLRGIEAVGPDLILAPSGIGSWLAALGRSG